MEKELRAIRNLLTVGVVIGGLSAAQYFQFVDVKALVQKSYVTVYNIARDQIEDTPPSVKVARDYIEAVGFMDVEKTEEVTTEEYYVQIQQHLKDQIVPILIMSMLGLQANVGPAAISAKPPPIGIEPTGWWGKYQIKGDEGHCVVRHEVKIRIGPIRETTYADIYLVWRGRWLVWGDEVVASRNAPVAPTPRTWATKQQVFDKEWRSRIWHAMTWEGNPLPEGK